MTELDHGGTATAVAQRSSPAEQLATYYRHVLFDNSLTPDRCFYSRGTVSPPSFLRLDAGKLPVDTEIFFTPPNALRLEWTSAPNGGWEATVLVETWRNRELQFEGDTLYFWCYTPDALARSQLPLVQLDDLHGHFTAPLSLYRFAPDIPAARWTLIKIPLRRFSSASLRPFNPRQVRSLTFVQGKADGTEHRMVIDEIGITRFTALPRVPPRPPRRISARGYDRHIDISWESDDDSAARYVIYRSLDGIHYKPVGIQAPGFDRYADFLGKPNQKVFYKVTASDNEYQPSSFSEAVSASTTPFDNDQLLNMVQEASIRYYWEGAHPVAGMALENIPGNPNMVATGASGFGIMAVLVGVERGFIPRPDALRHLGKILGFLERADRFHGAWAHFMDGRTGKALPVFGKHDNGGDLVETSFLMQGLLAARQYFRGPSPLERKLFQRVTALWESVEWDWYRRSPEGPFLYWLWSPDYSWYMNYKIIGFNETMMAYVLAIASPTHAVPASLYYSGWASRSPEAARYRRGWGHTQQGQYYANENSYYGIKLDVGVGPGGPLFFTHYSYMGLNPRQVRDRYTQYDKNNRAMALINRAYCMANPRGYKGYGARCWGLTASDGPSGYMAHEPTPEMDDGTMTPTGALASFPYLPDASLTALIHFYRELGDRLWGIFGFRDAFNLTEDWFARIAMGLNQAPIAVMIENYRSGLIWKCFMANPEIGHALEQIEAVSATARFGSGQAAPRPPR